jgi:peptidoglycan/xylan/chitin deacetylase (PgdA/CDA1 family)
MLRVAITFDDGYLEHFRTATLLREIGVRATFFVITGLQHWHGKALLALRPELIRKMREMGHEIGSHTITHPNLLALRDEETIEHELCRSKSYLERVVGSRVVGFAYPWGQHNDVIKDAVAKHYGYARVDAERYPPVIELRTRSMDKYAIEAKRLLKRTAPEILARRVVRANNDIVIVVHSIGYSELVLWVDYLKLLKARFVTLRELVHAE